MCVAQPYITGEKSVEVEATNTSPVPVLPRIGKPLKPVTESDVVLPKIGKGKQK